MADSEVTVKLSVSADNSAADDTSKAIAATGEAAKAAADDSSAAAKKSGDAISSVAAKASALRKAFAALAGVAAFSAIASAVSQIADSFKHAEKQADEFRKIQEMLAASKALQALEHAYSRIKDSVSQAAAAQSQAFELADAKTANLRRLEDANDNADKERELAELDPNSPDYDYRRSQIEARYAQRFAQRNASRAAEDVLNSQRKTFAQADSLDQQANAQAAQSALIQQQIRQARRDKSSADFDSYNLNDSDKGGFWSTFGTNIKLIASGDWGRVMGDTTAEGDKIRATAAQRSADLEKRIADLEEQLRQSQSKEQSLRSDASHKRALASEMDNTLNAVAIESRTSVNAANSSLLNATTSAADKNAMDADARQAVAQLSAELQRLKDEISSQQHLKDSASLDVFNASQNLSLARANNSNVPQAIQGLTNAQNAAFSVNASADAAIKALTDTLNDVKRRLDSAKSYLDKQSSQSRYAWSDAPSAS